MQRNIFIGGTGRSGTTVLAKTLGMSPHIYTFPFELRFHVDPYGLSSLWRAGSLNYNPPSSGALLESFLYLMKNSMVQPGTQPYRGFDLPNFFGSDFYYSAINDLEKEVCLENYPGFQLYAEPNIQIPKIHHFVRVVARRLIRAYGKLFDPTTYATMKRQGYEYTSNIYEMRFFRQSDELARVLGSFFELLAMQKVREQGAQVFCEHTPGNGCEARFIAAAMPQSCIVWISRNPAEVALSYRDQVWAPNGLKPICEMLEAQYDVWKRDKLELDKLRYPYLEIEIEELTSDPRSVISRIFELANIDTAIPETSHLLERRHSGIRKMTDDDASVINSFFPGRI